MEQVMLKKRMSTPEFERTLTALYGAERSVSARMRCEAVVDGFEQHFGKEPEALFSAPGRTEIGGNHTDHQHGHVLAAAVDLDILAAVSRRQSDLIRVYSQGYPLITVDLTEAGPKPEEKNTSAALIRGIAFKMRGNEKVPPCMGMDIYMVSDVPGGSGLSSSAAFEVLMGTIFNELIFDSRFSNVEIAQIGQYAENVFFGKPCGLMDQLAASVGGVVAVDFADPAAPLVEQIDLDLSAQGYALCIVDSKADHADLTEEYAAITDELRAVSHFFDREYLRDVPEEHFLAALPALREAVGDRAVLRAIHFYAEDRRAVAEAQALKDRELEGFLAAVRDSGRSSALYLQNAVPTGQTHDQELLLTIALCERLIAGNGAVRVHGGGFGGTALAIVPTDSLTSFRDRLELLLGPNTCRAVKIRPCGGIRLC